MPACWQFELSSLTISSRSSGNTLLQFLDRKQSKLLPDLVGDFFLGRSSSSSFMAFPLSNDVSVVRIGSRTPSRSQPRQALRHGRRKFIEVVDER